jgi:GT2 family glycosyltransferase
MVFGPVQVPADSPSTLVTAWMRTWCDDFFSRLTPEQESQGWHFAMGQANSSMLRSHLLASGGFDETLLDANEDTELGFRLWKSGLQFSYQPAALVRQVVVKSVRDLVAADALWVGRTEVLLCRKHPEYRPYSPLAPITQGPRWKRWLRQLITRLPLSPELLLRPLFAVADAFRQRKLAQRIGVRLLQARMGIIMYRSAMREAGSWKNLQDLIQLESGTRGLHNP